MKSDFITIKNVIILAEKANLCIDSVTNIKLSKYGYR